MRSKLLLCIGEALVDFVLWPPHPVVAAESCFRMSLGGAPTNVAVGLARLGWRSGVIGAIGADVFGEYIMRQLAVSGVETSGIVKKPTPTTLAFVFLSSDRNPQFTFVRNPGADSLLSPKDVDLRRVSSAGLLHFGSMSLSAAGSREATMRAVERARCSKALVSCDVNLRSNVWPSIQSARAPILSALEMADVVKLTADELALLSIASSRRKAVQELSAGKRLVAVTNGIAGSEFYSPHAHISMKALPVRTVDSTAAGDAFMAAFLSGLIALPVSPEDIGQLSEQDIRSSCELAQAAGAFACTRSGTLASLPSYRQLRRFIRAHR